MIFCQVWYCAILGTVMKGIFNGLMLDIFRSLKKDTVYKSFYMQEITSYEYTRYYSVDWQSG